MSYSPISTIQVTTANVNNAIIQRDGSGEFSSGNVTSPQLQTAHIPSGTGTSDPIVVTSGNANASPGSSSNQSGTLTLKSGNIDDDTNPSGDVNIGSGANANSGGIGDVNVTGNVIRLFSAETAIQNLQLQNDGTADHHKIVLLADPTDPQDAANKQYVDSHIIILPSGSLTLVNGDTIPITSSFLAVNSAGPINTSSSTVIATGATSGQILVVVNFGTQNITIKAGGNVVLPGSVDFVLTASSVISFIKATGVNDTWYTTATSLS